MFYIQDRTTATLQPLITAFTAPGNIGTTDQWGGYNFLARNATNILICEQKSFKNQCFIVFIKENNDL